MKTLLSGIGKWCAYSHIFKAFTVLINGGQISEQTRAGRNIALLGFFCPFFWIALFTGAEASSLAFHATHSGIVFLIGIAIMVASIKKQQHK
ncbi:hypothetical protein ACQKPX_14755 [Photobacterium sp. DNB23_23_1]|uniref:Uncharacterized protein n=1 Tax=Photobacterium pectinilyticum TaxID=2906793 RepID=A0ABT1N6E0_9GAMM|nr:hypothetical protein [Photobacterium sp. ZSDE20]MCQ1060313.1 hypothetical protein [Photobacterium sp. ZSDE20]MDD1828162.1 hypothetical protein [Photobacterium sp. ZSDE20]